MKIKLNSDFLDIYDHYFCQSWENEDEIFDRMSINDISRMQMFMFFEDLGIKTPIWGYINRSLKYERLSYELRDVVVYLDEFSHRGNRKLKMPFSEACQNFDGYLCSQYVNNYNKCSESYRYLKVGRYTFLLKYTSNHEWMSNCGNVDIKILKQFDFDYYNIDCPLYAIDFVEKDFTKYAVDFNTSPGLKNTGIEAYLTNKQIYEEIENFYLTKNKK